MSASQHRAQADRLMGDVAALRKKLAAARQSVSTATGKVTKAVDAARKARTPSQVAQRGRDLERAQSGLAKAERDVGAREAQIATKQKQLSSAETSLARTEKTAQQKDDRETERRRRAELDHVRELERRRRHLTDLPPVRPTPRAERSAATFPFNETFDVCLSFAGEQRTTVDWIAERLKDADVKVFYDRDDEIAAKIWGHDLAEIFDWVYREGSRLCLMFVSQDYAEKSWPRHERRSALARALDEDGYVLPVRFDDTQLPGLRPTTGFIDVREVAPATIVEYVLERLAR